MEVFGQRVDGPFRARFLGPCPLLKGIALTGGQRYWLKVRAGAGAAAHIVNGTMYTLVVDFVY